MRESVREAIAETVKGLIASGIDTPFTKEQLEVLGVEKVEDNN